MEGAVTFTMLLFLFLSNQTLEDKTLDHSDNQHTNIQTGAVCVAGLAVNQNKEHPLGCKSTRLLVQLLLTTDPMLQTSTRIHE